MTEDWHYTAWGRRDERRGSQKSPVKSSSAPVVVLEGTRASCGGPDMDLFMCLFKHGASFLDDVNIGCKNSRFYKLNFPQISVLYILKGVALKFIMWFWQTFPLWAVLISET